MSSIWQAIKTKVGEYFAAYLTKELQTHKDFDDSDISLFSRTLREGDVLLVEGRSRVSKAIKYLTQSSWSHVAIVTRTDEDPERCLLVEADLSLGVIEVPLSKYSTYSLRICRAVSLSDIDVQNLLQYVNSRLGNTYDLSNLVDLVRYFIQSPPVPSRYRRNLLALGSGDPTKAICSTLLAKAFQSINYPILPRKLLGPGGESEQECLQVRHYSHFVPRDFDLSPYFKIVKPTIEQLFDFKQLKWLAVDESNFDKDNNNAF